MNVRALAPAKLNLGLAVLGRRADGYHEVRTIMTAVTLFDRIRFSQRDSPRVLVEGARIEEDENLAGAAARLLAGYDPGIAPEITIRKRIPVAAGLGGASSDAAATLLALNRLYDLGLTKLELQVLALRLGSDVPFLLFGGMAKAAGRGERLSPLMGAAHGYAVVVSPAISIPNKTAALYAALLESDFTGGSEIEEGAALISRGKLPKPEHLANVFTRALYALAPMLAPLPEEMRRFGAKLIGLSGAGPSHYALFDDLEEARRVTDRFREAFAQTAAVHCTRFPAPGVLLCGPTRSPTK